ncbi:hypothetical protein Corgl_0819 [Coriobacterium glomerans PW2]|uniref:Flavodoxin domain-containing protein n=1 Tax=Coriobacterium glomerans (strain ATCC 49209 / DSM 20642 / JCM 10262 / PW2) TaxID=700015 RepID=F2N7P0_CORGP|nr:hypothetical protein [Coriobacterium glomerans]AEB06932.1 hypothetical protein Corgl_0819 [Coriobacterium glomerans PW2]
MKTVILYRSRHHGNTLRLVDAILAAHPEVDAIDVGALSKDARPDIDRYHLVGVASGIYYSSMDKRLMRAVEAALRPGDKVFGLMTYGGRNNWYGRDLDGVCRMKHATYLGAYGALGYDTWGPFRLFGGLHKGHPSEQEIADAVAFYDKILDEYGDIIDEQYAQRARRLSAEAANPRGGVVALIKRTISSIAGHFS